MTYASAINREREVIDANHMLKAQVLAGVDMNPDRCQIEQHDGGTLEDDHPEYHLLPG
jgi:hypothetical protein